MKATNSIFSALALGVLILFSACKNKGDDDGPILLNCDDFQSDMTLVDDPERPVDYYIDCVMDVTADITVGPGVVIDFASDAGINVTATGSFQANGATDAPIVMKGENASSGSWKGILFNSNNIKNKLTHTQIKHAGGGIFNSNGDQASVIIWADAKLEMNNCLIESSGKYGISAIYTNSDWSITQSTVTGCENAPAIFLAPYVSAFDGSNNFTGNAVNYLTIDLATQSIVANSTLKRTSVPYRITSTYQFFDMLTVDNSTLVIEKGAELYFEEGTGMLIEDDAALIAAGTADDPIIFKGINPTAGSWTTIYFNATTSASNLISHAEIHHAGAEYDNSQGGILMRVSPTLTVSDVLFQDISACSIYHKATSLNANLTATNNVHNNTQGTLCSD